MKTNSIILTYSILMILCSSCKKEVQNQVKPKNSTLTEIQNPNFDSNKKNINYDYSGSFIIDDTSRYQIIYSSQNYETFYEVFAKCRFDANGFLENINLKIVNFKGPFNLGFARYSEIKTKLHYVKKDSILGIALIVKGLSSDDDETPILNEKIHKTQIKKLNVIRTLMPFDTSLTRTTENEVFDSEFHYRSGTNTTEVRRNSKPGQFNYKPNYKSGTPIQDLLNIDHKLDSLFKQIEPKGISGNCYTSSNFVFFKKNN